MQLNDHVMAAHLFRIVQEAITNAVRHGGCSEVRIVLHLDSHRLLLRVEDNGCGFVDDGNKSGLGLHSMAYRAGIVGGSLRIRDRRGGRGTSVACLVKGWKGRLADVDTGGNSAHEQSRHAGPGGR
jgi:signal transduction histidine kinase